VTEYTRGSADATTWSTLKPAVRVEVARLAALGEPHSDTAVRLAAHDWATSPMWARWYHKAPSWLLPLLGVLVGALSIVLGILAELPWPLLALLGLMALFVVVGGLLAGNVRAIAVTIRELRVD
jgi:hypothetical protein